MTTPHADEYKSYKFGGFLFKRTAPHTVTAYRFGRPVEVFTVGSMAEPEATEVQVEEACKEWAVTLAESSGGG